MTCPPPVVTMETMIGMDGPGTINEMILATGMTDGMETSYARLESQVMAAV